nr:laccase-13-like [Quercus suber]
MPYKSVIDEEKKKAAIMLWQLCNNIVVQNLRLVVIKVPVWGVVFPLETTDKTERDNKVFVDVSTFEEAEDDHKINNDVECKYTLEIDTLAVGSGVRKNPSPKNLLTVDSNLFHLHGYNFFVVGSGIVNFDSAEDPAKFDLDDPPKRNTVGSSNWRCLVHSLSPGAPRHEELKMAFVVENGKSPEESIIPPPNDLPPC